MDDSKYRTARESQAHMNNFRFIDLFSGCGGLSLGLSMAGLQGRFAIEKDEMAFQTFSTNFLSDRENPLPQFDWPYWLRKKAWNIDELIKEHRGDLMSLDGEIEIIAGGPPCQGFSFAGKRNESDPRNLLFQKYVEVIDAVRPKALILENVPGMKVAHANKKVELDDFAEELESYYEKLRRSLDQIGYVAHGELLDASRFGVPQKRLRLIVIGIRRDLVEALDGGIERVFEILEQTREENLNHLGLSRIVSARDAIHDLRVLAKPKRACRDIDSPSGFEELIYDKPDPDSPYQQLMHNNCSNDEMDSMRLARHSDVVRERFALILNECPRGVPMNQFYRDKFGLKKHRIHPMDENEPAPTITTLPDDVLHYEEPRILTVRESARIQSFPDWFRFRGKYTTGGILRTKECPRYTQVGNAVPPLLARAIGLAVRQTITEAENGLASPLKQSQHDKCLVAA